MSELSRGREQRASSLKQVNECAVQVNERTDEQVAQYLRLYSCLFQTTVHRTYQLGSIIINNNNLGQEYLSYLILRSSNSMDRSAQEIHDAPMTMMTGKPLAPLSCLLPPIPPQRSQ